MCTSCEALKAENKKLRDRISANDQFLSALRYTIRQHQGLQTGVRNGRSNA